LVNQTEAPTGGSPQFGINGTASTATTGDPFVFSINVTDNVSVSSVSVNYTWSGAGQWFNKTMVNIGGSIYTNLSQMPTTNVTIEYYFWAINVTAGTNLTGPGFVTVLDNDPPVLVSGSGNISAICSTPFTIYANFTDNVNVTSAVIYYRTESNATYQNVAMTEHVTLDGIFSVTNSTMNLNIYNSTENISYYILAYDGASNQVRYEHPGSEDWNITIIDDLAPVVLGGRGDMKTGTGDYFEIYANFTDNVNVTYAFIYFKHQTDSFHLRCNMTPASSPGSFITNILNLSQQCGISTINSTTPVVYYIHGYDDFGNFGNYTNSSLDWSITFVDNDIPEIINGSKDFTVTTGEPFTIYANFTDNIEISHADIFYKHKGSQDPFFAKAMIEIPGKPGCFYINDANLGLDTYTDNTAIWYYVYVYDTTGNQKQYTKPGSWWKISIIDNDPPAFHSGEENITIGTGDKFVVKANFTDNIEIKFIRFYYKNEAWDHWEFNEFSVQDVDTDKVWEFVISSDDLDVIIDTANDDSDYFYYIHAFDARPITPNKFAYTYGTIGFKIMVIDDDPPESLKPQSEAGSGDSTVTTGEPFLIHANFSDNIEVDYAKLFIRKKGTIGWPAGINMSEFESKPGRFSISNSSLNINTTIDDSDFEYYAICFDTTGNSYEYIKDKEASEPFILSVIDNDKPIVMAGEDVTVEEGTTVEFNGNASYDNIGIVSYQWTFKYENLDQILDGVKKDFKFETIGYYKITLSAIDAQGNKGTDEIIVNVIIKNYPPEIESVNPESGEKIYVFDENLNIYVRFTEDMNISAKNVGFFFMNDSSGNPVPGTYNWFVDGVKEIFELRFIPTDELIYDETYTITITTGVSEKFEAGLNLKAGKTWSFSTYSLDSDRDGLPDWWEMRFFTSINEAGPDSDDDKDGFTNLEEYLGRDGKPGGDDSTNPKDRNSHPPEKEAKDDTTQNIILVSIILIIVILLLIIISVFMMLRKKKKAEEEEKKKPKEIEHEILFEDGKGLPGPAPTGEIQMEPSLGTMEMEKSPELESEARFGEGISEPEGGVEDEQILDDEMGPGQPEPEQGFEEESRLETELEPDLESEPELGVEGEIEGELGLDAGLEEEPPMMEAGEISGEELEGETDGESKGEAEPEDDEELEE
jgi:hypothetical protein